MAGMEFVIPASKEELRRDEGKGVYVVRQTFDNDELAIVLEGMLRHTVRSLNIRKYFRVFYSV